MTTPTLTPYTRPELTDQDRADAHTYAANIFKRHGIRNVTLMLAALCLENIRLLKEVNDHRAARGYEPLPAITNE